MSYFMTIAGPPIDVSGLEPLELVPADQAQDYIRDRAAELSALDGTPLFLVHDGETWTSHALVGDVIYDPTGCDTDTTSWVIPAFLSRLGASHTVRVWWADNEPDTHLKVEDCGSVAEFLRRLRESDHGSLGLRFQGSHGGTR